MRVPLVLAAAAAVLSAQGDPAREAYQSWEATQRGVDYRTRAQHLLEASAGWVSKWPDSNFAWHERREALVDLRSPSAELWKQVNENLMRLSPPHTFAVAATSDWVTMGVNVEAAEKLLLDEIAWEESRPRPALPANATLADLVDEADFTGRLFVLWCTLARAQIRLRQFDAAQKTIERVHGWLDGDFRRYYDMDPLEAFPDYGAKYFQLSAELAVARGRKADALAFYHAYLADPYYRREYGAPSEMNPPKSLWKEIGGTDAGWAAYSAVPPLPPGVPAGWRGGRFPAWAGAVYFPWVKLEYKLPPMQIPDLEGRTWTNRDFAGKATIVYLWAAWCAPCWPALKAVQMISDRVKGRTDVQIMTLNVDEDGDKLAALMKQKGYTFPVLANKPYVQTVLPRFIVGQFWIMDGDGKVRLQRTNSTIAAGAEGAYVEELLYKARQFRK